MQYALYFAWGGGIGLISGLVGLGGGVVIIPTLIWLFGLTQHQAQGTCLAMLVPPIGLLAAYRYWQAGNVLIPIAAFGALGFFLGSYFGADWAQAVPEVYLRRGFGAILILSGVSLIWK